MVHIITDTTSALSPKIAAHYDIPVIPQIIHFGEESFHEGIDIDNQEFMRRLQEGDVHPKTAAPEPELFIEQFERLTTDGEPILCIHPSTEVSGTVRSATIAAQEFPGADIRVIDTRLIASPLGTLVKLAAQWAKEGGDADTIEARIQDMAPHCHIYFLVATLEYLARGGRIGGAARLLGSALNLKPLLTIEDGRVEVLEKIRSRGKAIQRMLKLAEETLDGQRPVAAGIIDVDAANVAEEVTAEVMKRLKPKQFYRTAVTPVVGGHAGPGTIGLGFYTEV